MDIVILFIGILTLSSLGYVIYKFNDKGDNTDNTQQRQDEINQMKEMLTLEFKNLANEIFEEKTKKITEVNKENLSNILDPLKENIARFERKVESSNKDAVEFNAILKSEINHLKNETLKMRDDANNLANALRGESKTQGDWGEQQMETILNAAGLEKNIHYEKEKNLKNENQDNQRLDYIVKLPGDKCIIIDSKVSLVAYVNYYNSEDKEDKKHYLKEHLKSINTHITTLSNKNYQDLDINQPDYILMFMANEPAFKLAVLEDVSLYNKAIDRNIVMVTNSTLFATLKTVAYMWKQDKANKNAIEIARQAGSLYDKFQSFSEDLIKVGNNLNTTKNTYEDAMKKLTDGKDNLVRKTERLRELGAKASKKINPKLLDRSE
ncbi:MAG: DNA recombination protein RmuC [Bacteroidota bacterium]|jgi:DNA recombination protein RmuC|nr:DNA recombination protein RmuC [Bacteroidota bacterium]MEC8679129.1 DNA recombination protein RmuC [Bacteroidota bacterium]|tara:strand:+ start:4390 stop:5529 length:1140 start_codon:yes stop_codon:yes gene_type:complete